MTYHVAASKNQHKCDFSTTTILRSQLKSSYSSKQTRSLPETCPDCWQTGDSFSPAPTRGHSSSTTPSAQE
ncbi:hypothetical protein OSTOST_18258 [Ostertagia ostertagi]